MGSRWAKESERRSRQDVWSVVLLCLNLSAWGVIAGFLVVIEKAKPQYETFFDRFYRLELRTNWDLDVFNYLYYLIAAGLIISTAGFCLSLVRARRKTDGKGITFLIMWCLSFAALAALQIFLF
ncbi:MAG: hypothetical protein R6V54_04705 [Desulfobacteraceae bacterium]